MPTSTDELAYSNLTRIVGQDEANAVDVSDTIGKKRMNTEAVNVINSSIITTVLTVGTSAVEVKVGASRLANRRMIIVSNTGTGIIYYGASGVTSNNGMPIYKKQTLMLDIGDVPLYLIALTAGNTIRVSEGA